MEYDTYNTANSNKEDGSEPSIGIRYNVHPYFPYSYLLAWTTDMGLMSPAPIPCPFPLHTHAPTSPATPKPTWYPCPSTTITICARVWHHLPQWSPDNSYHLVPPTLARWICQPHPHLVQPANALHPQPWPNEQASSPNILATPPTISYPPPWPDKPTSCPSHPPMNAQPSNVTLTSQFCHFNSHHLAILSPFTTVCSHYNPLSNWYPATDYKPIPDPTPRTSAPFDTPSPSRNLACSSTANSRMVLNSWWIGHLDTYGTLNEC